MLNNIDTDRAIHSFKTAFACLLGYLLLKLTQFGTQPWLVITVIVVMCAQINVGSVIQKSYMRFLGTLVGSVFAFITLLLFGTNEIAFISCICLSVLLFSYLATSDKPYSDAGTLGAVTTVMILIGQNPTLSTAGIRTLEISMGILIAALVSQFILPIHARVHLRRNQAMTLRKLKDYYQLTLMSGASAPEMAGAEDIEEKIINLLVKQRKLAKEASQELLGKHFNVNAFKKSLHCEKQMLRCVIFMRQFHKLSSTGEELLNHQLWLPQFNADACAALMIIADQIEKPTIPAVAINIPAICDIKKIVQTASQQLDERDYLYICNFICCAELFLKHLEDLVVHKKLLVNKLS